jgi:galactose mutarotase-like enzyme
MTVTLRDGDTELEVVPERGAIVSRLTVAGQELLYLDRSTLEDREKLVRGGIPLLFPFAGRLVDDRFLLPDPPTIMKKHGFGRNSAWEQRDERTFTLAATDATRAVFPYDFVASYEIRPTPRGVALALTVRNTGEGALPLSPGWHPYFRCDDKTRVQSDVRGWDPSRLREDAEFDFGLPLPETAHFDVPGVGPIRLTGNLHHLQVWSLPGRPFVCIEPFAGPANHINTDGRDEVAAGRAYTYLSTIELAAIS